jgi:hypothetical protein
MADDITDQLHVFDAPSGRKLDTPDPRGDGVVFEVGGLARADAHRLAVARPTSLRRPQSSTSSGARTGSTAPRVYLTVSFCSTRRWPTIRAIRVAARSSSPRTVTWRTCGRSGLRVEAGTWCRGRSGRWSSRERTQVPEHGRLVRGEERGRGPRA